MPLQEAFLFAIREGNRWVAKNCRLFTIADKIVNYSDLGLWNKYNKNALGLCKRLFTDRYSDELILALN
ncbi:MAG: hypothetical protein EKK64_10220 [Neisseriaceae bacterium]|nr:MAG: hypothetical protein EKK64_10220 [Neisseriaceae bacterium]